MALHINSSKVPVGDAFRRLSYARVRVASASSVFGRARARLELKRAELHWLANEARIQSASPALYGVPTMQGRVAQVAHKLVR